MKTTKFKLAVLLILLTLSIKTEAQNQVSAKINTYEYKAAIGLRAGETSGITYKNIFKNKSAFEGIVSFWPYSIGITGLYEIMVPTNTKGLTFYYGAGAHLNAGNYYNRSLYYHRNDRFNYIERRNNFAIGLDGIVGIEYKFKPIPFAISADLKPFIETTSSRYTYLSIDPGIGIKFTF